MTAERPQKSVVKEVVAQNATPFISPETVFSSVPIAEKLAEGKSPEQKDVSSMVKQVAEDLRAQGMPISSDDIKVIEQKTRQSFSPPSSSEQSTIELKKSREANLPDNIDLNEYQRVIEGFEKNYGLDKRAWGKISAILVGSELTGQTLSAAQRALLESGAGFTNLQDKFKEISAQLKLEDKSPGQFWSAIWKRGENSYTKKDATMVGTIVLKALWPMVASPVYWFIDRQGRQIAGKMFLTERAKLQEHVNNRIADSLYMRNFEFLHDKSSAEMLQVINNGKDATVDLVSAVYEDLIPLKWAQQSMVGSQFLFGAINSILSAKAGRSFNVWRAPLQFSDFISASFKKILLDKKIKPNAQKIQEHRAEELAQWDKVNTKLLTTLQGLETVRTAGNAESGSDMLYGSLAQRDFVEQGGFREKRMQERAMNRLFDSLDIAFPYSTAILSTADFLKNEQIEHVVDKETNRTELGKPNAADMLFYVWGSLAQASRSRSEQMALRQSFLQLTHLYTDRIIPDIQDIQRMEELLGPYDKLDHPMGLKERARIPATNLTNFDIKVEHLNFKHILHDVNLVIPQGSFVTIKGPSGIGKSTLFRHLVGLYEGDSGSVSFGGVNIDGIRKYGDSSLHQKIAYANQSPQYFEDMTLRENLLLWTPKDIPQEKIETVLRDLKLEHLADRLDSKSKHFSGGELRRIGIARALLKDPRVLFLDEPTANLDAVSTVQVLKIIQDLRKKRPDMTVVAITHDPVFEKISEKIVDFEQINKKPILADNQILEAVARAH